MIKIETLKDLSDKNYLWLYCNECNHNKELIVSDLKEKYGESFSLKELRSRAVCSSCGSRDTTIQMGYGKGLVKKT